MAQGASKVPARSVPAASLLRAGAVHDERGGRVLHGRTLFTALYYYTRYVGQLSPRGWGFFGHKIRLTKNPLGCLPLFHTYSNV